MRASQSGFGVLQILMSVVGVIVVASVAAPKYEAFVIESKITEAFTLAGDAKTKLMEFYITKNRFPETEEEASSIQVDTFTPPEFVKNLVVNPNSKEHEIVIQVYFKPGAISELVGDTDFVYVAGNKSTVGGALVQWTCGSIGIDSEYLPERCQE